MIVLDCCLSFCLSLSLSLSPSPLSLCLSFKLFFGRYVVHDKDKLFLISWLCLIVWQWQEACSTRSMSIGWSLTWSMLASTTATLLFGRISLWRYGNHQWDFSFCHWTISLCCLLIFNLLQELCMDWPLCDILFIDTHTHTQYYAVLLFLLLFVCLCF